MSSRLNPYISFNGDARAALELYEDVFGATLVLHTFGVMVNITQPAATA